MKAKVILTPLGNKIRARIVGKMVCIRNQNREMQKSIIQGVDSSTWIDVFGTKNAVNKFIKKNKQIQKVVNIHKCFDYDYCDQII